MKRRGFGFLFSDFWQPEWNMLGSAPGSAVYHQLENGEPLCGARQRGRPWQMCSSVFESATDRVWGGMRPCKRCINIMRRRQAAWRRANPKPEPAQLHYDAFDEEDKTQW